VVESRLPLRAPRWEDDPDYALEHHVHHVALRTGKGTAIVTNVPGPPGPVYLLEFELETLAHLASGRSGRRAALAS